MFDQLVKFVRHSPFEEHIKTDGQTNAQRLTAYSRVRANLRAWPVKITISNVEELKMAQFLGASSFNKIQEGLKSEGYQHQQPTCCKLEKFLYSHDEESKTARVIRQLTR